jgi:hypothetical protein
MLDLVGDNPVSRLPLSRFKNVDGVKNDVIASLMKQGPAGRLKKATSFKDKPPIKVRVKKGGLKSKASLRTGIKKTVSMPVKHQSKAPAKSKSTVSGIPKLSNKKSLPAMTKTKSTMGKISNSVSASTKTRIGRSADGRKGLTNLKNKKSVSRV